MTSKNLPSHWNYLPLRAIFTESDETCGDNSYELLSVTQDRGIIKQSDVDIKKDTSNDDKSKYKVVLKNSIAYNKMRMWQGAVGINEIEDGIVSPAYVVINPLKEMNTRFYFYLFKTPYMISLFGKYSYGLVDDMNTLRYDDFQKIYIPIPPLEEQNKIVEYIDKKSTQIENFIQKKTRFISLLKEEKEAVINEAITKGIDKTIEFKDSGIKWLGDIPKHWEVRKLKFVAKNKTDKKLESNFKIGLENIESKTSKFIESEEVVFAEAGIEFKRGDILFGKLRPYLAKIYLTEKDGICVSEFLVLRCFEITNQYLKYLMISSKFIDIVNGSTYGSKMPRANWEFIGNTKIPLPLYEEQKQIVEYIETKLNQIDKIIDKTTKQIDLIKEYKTSLINEAVSRK